MIRLLRYVCSLAFGPIAQATLGCISLFARDSRVKIGCWTFLGPSETTTLVQESITFLEKEDPELFKQLFQKKYTCLCDIGKNELMCTPGWGYMGIPEGYLAWKKEGVAVALIYFHWKIDEWWSKGSWYHTDPQNSRQSGQICMTRTDSWINAHGFPSELLMSPTKN